MIDFFVAEANRSSQGSVFGSVNHSISCETRSVQIHLLSRQHLMKNQQTLLIPRTENLVWKPTF
jgi:hypothetical protein